MVPNPGATRRILVGLSTLTSVETAGIYGNPALAEDDVRCAAPLVR